MLRFLLLAGLTVGGSLPASAAPPFSPGSMIAAQEADRAGVADEAARAFISEAIYGDALRAALTARIDECVTAGKLTATAAGARRSAASAYASVWIGHFPQAQLRLGALLSTGFDAVELTTLDTFYRSDVGIKLIRLAAAGAVQPAVSRLDLCDLPVSGPVDQAALAQRIMGQMSPIEIDELGAFGATSASSKFHVRLPAISDLLRTTFIDAANDASARSGLKPVAP